MTWHKQSMTHLSHGMLALSMLLALAASAHEVVSQPCQAEQGNSCGTIGLNWLQTKLLNHKTNDLLDEDEGKEHGHVRHDFVLKEKTPDDQKIEKTDRAEGHVEKKADLELKKKTPDEQNTDNADRVKDHMEKTADLQLKEKTLDEQKTEKADRAENHVEKKADLELKKKTPDEQKTEKADRVEGHVEKNADENVLEAVLQHAMRSEQVTSSLFPPKRDEEDAHSWSILEDEVLGKLNASVPDCIDVTIMNQQKWYASYGSWLTCDAYSIHNLCAGYGAQFMNYGLVANDACCACGGGDKTRRGSYIMKPYMHQQECMIIAWNGHNTHHVYNTHGTRHMWSPHDWDYCGMPGGVSGLLHNKQAVWEFEVVENPDSSGKVSYMIHPAKYPNQCMILGNHGHDHHASRWNWGQGSTYCGMPGGKQGLVHNAQALWHINFLKQEQKKGSRKMQNLFTIAPVKYPKQCMIIGHNGHSPLATRHNWHQGHSYCGFPGGKQSLISNGQAVWILEKLEGDAVLPTMSRPIAHIKGYWQDKHNLDPHEEKCVKTGIKETWTEEKTKEFSVAMELAFSQTSTASVTAGSFGGSSETSVSMGIRSSWTQQFKSSYSKVVSTETKVCRKYDPNLTKGQFLWIFALEVDYLGSKEYVNTDSVAYTKNKVMKPKCYPGTSTDGLYYQECEPGHEFPN